MAHHIRSFLNWTTTDLDAILRQGDSQHLATLHDLGWLVQERNNTMLDVDELPSVIKTNLWGKRYSVSVGVKEGATYGYTEDIQKVLESALKEHPGVSCILRMQGKCRAILTEHSGFSVFDPHACDEKGLPHPDGKAGLYKFQSTSEVSCHLKSIADRSERDQVDVNPVWVTLISEELTSQTEFLTVLSSESSSGSDKGSNIEVHGLECTQSTGKLASLIFSPELSK